VIVIHEASESPHITRFMTQILKVTHGIGYLAVIAPFRHLVVYPGDNPGDWAALAGARQRSGTQGIVQMADSKSRNFTNTSRTAWQAQLRPAEPASTSLVPGRQSGLDRMPGCACGWNLGPRLGA
jgi:hypothetical protein